MRIKINISAVGRSRWYEYVVRFGFGGAVTVLAGLIAKQYGPGVGGLFLAFPAIFPASATLIEKHEKQKKERAGKEGSLRGRAAAGADAAGAAIGSLGLLAFAVVVWQWMPTYQAAIVLCVATAVWFAVAFLLWEIRETVWRRLRAKLPHQPIPSTQVHTPHRTSNNRRSDE